MHSVYNFSHTLSKEIIGRIFAVEEIIRRCVQSKQARGMYKSILDKNIEDFPSSSELLNGSIWVEFMFTMYIRL